MRILFALMLLGCSHAFAQPPAPKKIIHATVSAEELKLYNLIMKYRKENGLPAIPLSNSLTYVAQTHCRDLVDNKPDTANCNAHSWSTGGSWSACCYTPDHARATYMWVKPRELTNYTGNGYEIGHGSSAVGDYLATAESALSGWQHSPGHNSVILNKENWKSMKWKAIGIAVYKNFSMVWFGIEADPDGTPGKSSR